METKQAYQEKIEAKLKELDAKISELEAKAQQAEAEAKVEYHQQVEALRAKRDEAREELEQIMSAGEGAWEELKSGIKRTLNELGEAIDRAVGRFKEDKRK